MITKLIVGLTLFFLLVTLGQLSYLHWRLQRAPSIEIPASGASWGDTLTALELGVIERRYHYANTMLMLSIWTRYLGFVTGMMLSMIGATFVLGKLRSPESSGELGIEGAKLALRSASPGVILAFLGTLLMVTVIVYRPELQVTDRSVYIETIREPTELGSYPAELDPQSLRPNNDDQR